MSSPKEMKCPKCAFPQHSDSSECMRCGVIFSRIKDEATTRILLSCTIPREKKNLFQILLSPLAAAKKYGDHIHAAILGLIWNELIRGETEYGQSAHLAAFIVVSAVSLLLYRFGRYQDLLIFGLLVIFCLDYHATRYKFRNRKGGEKLTLVKRENSVLELTNSGMDKGDSFRLELTETEIDYILFSTVDHVWGAFAHTVARGWQIRLVLKTGVRVVVYESIDLNRALVQSRSLARELKAPLRIDGNEKTSGHPAESPHGKPNENEAPIDGISIHVSKDKTTIEKKTGLKSCLPLFGSILELSGFFLFLLIMTGIFTKFGMLLSFLIGPHMGLELPYIQLDLSFRGMLGIFIPEFEPTTLLEYSLAVGIILYRIRIFLTPVSITIDSQKTDVTVGNRLQGRLKTESLALPLLLEEPRPLIVLTDSKRALKIENLANPQEQLALVKEVSKVVSKFRGPRS